MIKNVVKSLVAVSTIVAYGAAAASVVVYTDRSAWEAAVTGGVTENFNSFADGTVVTGATVFPSGITATASGTLDISSFAFSAIGQGNALRTFVNTTIVMPRSPVAFGFDYADLDLGGASIAFGTFSQALALTGDADSSVTSDDFAFFGVVATAADIPGGTFSFTSVLEGFVIDNLSFAVAPPVKVVGAAIYGDVAGGTSLSSSQQLSTASVAEFNAKYTDAAGVAYLSFAGRSASHLAEAECKSSLAPPFVKKYDLVRDPIEPLLAVSALIVEHGTEIPSDGLVTIESAKWGEFHGCVPADHFDEIGHLFPDSPGFGNSFEHIPFYEGIVQLLRDRGL